MKFIVFLTLNYLKMSKKSQKFRQYSRDIPEHASLKIQSIEIIESILVLYTHADRRSITRNKSQRAFYYFVVI